MEPSQTALQDANRVIRAFLLKFPGAASQDWSSLPAPAEVESLASQLRAAAALVADRGSPLCGSSEFTAYVENLRHLQDLFASLEPKLFAERTELASQRRQIVASRAWATALKSTR